MEWTNYTIIFNLLFFIIFFRRARQRVKHRTPKIDGLNSIEPLYKLVKIEKLPLYTYIYSDVKEAEIPPNKIRTKGKKNNDSKYVSYLTN